MVHEQEMLALAKIAAPGPPGHWPPRFVLQPTRRDMAPVDPDCLADCADAVSRACCKPLHERDVEGKIMASCRQGAGRLGRPGDHRRAVMETLGRGHDVKADRRAGARVPDQARPGLPERRPDQDGGRDGGCDRDGRPRPSVAEREACPPYFLAPAQDGQVARLRHRLSPRPRRLSTRGRDRRRGNEHSGCVCGRPGRSRRRASPGACAR